MEEVWIRQSKLAAVQLGCFWSVSSSWLLLPSDRNQTNGHVEADKPSEESEEGRRQGKGKTKGTGMKDEMQESASKKGDMKVSLYVYESILQVAKGIATSNKDATRGSWPYY